MVFTAPEWVTRLPFDPPDSIPICDFMLDEAYGRHPLRDSKPPFTCGLSGLEYSALEVRGRVENLAKGLAKELNWHPNKGTAWDKVVGVFSVNTIDTMTLAWATHRLSGISSPANAAYSAAELEYQLRASGCRTLFTCLPLLPIALEAASKCEIARSRVYLFSSPKEVTDGQEALKEFKTVDRLIEDGESLERLEPLRWTKGQGARQTAFLCFSSGTSGLPKGVMISHRNVIANVCQIVQYDKPHRDSLVNHLDVSLGLMPQSHIYALVRICHASTYRGDQVISLPRFDLNLYLNAIQQFKINTLYVVPPIIIVMTKNKALCDKFDLSSVKVIFTGAAPLGSEMVGTLQTQHPSWLVLQAYGLTEASTVVASTSFHDVWFGSCGSLLPSIEARIVSSEGLEVSGYDQPGELLIRSPSVALGYLNNEIATKETFQDGWMRTGDEAVIKKSPRGFEHIWIMDRIKELIKVKGVQVAPAELEAHLLSHPAVTDAAVIPVPDADAGEVPKAFVVKSPSVGLEANDRTVIRNIQKHVEQHKASYKWLRGGVEFIDTIPKSPSGKILRRLLRDKERDNRKEKASKL